MDLEDQKQAEEVIIALQWIRAYRETGPGDRTCKENIHRDQCFAIRDRVAANRPALYRAVKTALEFAGTLDSPAEIAARI